MRRFLERGRFKKSVQTHSLEGDNQNSLFDFVHPDDRDAYMAFAEPDTLIKRIEAAEAGYLSEEFRRRRSLEEPYIWHQYTVFLMPNSENLVMQMVRRAPHAFHCGCRE